MAVTPSRLPPPPSFVLRGHAGGVTHAELLCDGVHDADTVDEGVIVSGDEDGELRVWSVPLRRPLAKVRAHSRVAGVQSVRALSYSGNGGLELVSQGRDTAMRVHAIRADGSHESRALLREDTAVTHAREYSFCKLARVVHTANGSAMIASPRGDDGRRAAVVDVRSGGEAFATQPAPVAGSGTPAVRGGGGGGDALVGDGTAGQMMSVQLQESSAGGMELLCSYEDGSVHCWDARQGARPVCSLKMSDEPLLCAHAVPMTAGGAYDGIDVGVHGNTLRGIAAGAGVGVHAIVLGATHSQPGHEAPPPPSSSTTQATLDTTSARTLHRVGGFTLRRAGAGGVDVRCSDARVAAVGCWDASVRLYDLKRERALAVLRYHTAPVTSVSFAPNGTRLASSSRDGSIAVWDVDFTPPPPPRATERPRDVDGADNADRNDHVRLVDKG